MIIIMKTTKMRKLMLYDAWIHLAVWFRLFNLHSVVECFPTLSLGSAAQTMPSGALSLLVCPGYIRWHMPTFIPCGDTAWSMTQDPYHSLIFSFSFLFFPLCDELQCSCKRVWSRWISSMQQTKRHKCMRVVVEFLFHTITHDQSLFTSTHV